MQFSEITKNLSDFFSNIGGALSYALKAILGVLTDITPRDVIDVIVVTFLIYKTIQFIRDTRAEQLMKGALVLIFGYIAADLLELQALFWIFKNIILQIALFAIVVVFQPELRRALEKVGRSNLSSLGRSLTAEEAEEQQRRCIDAICKACAEFSKSDTGALIVVERSTMLGDIVNTGTILDAGCNAPLLMNIFYPNTPLHDGAVIIRGAKIYAAGCILPLTENDELTADLGTRHRAAIGMSETSDAVVVVVSEETGTISAAQDGTLIRGLNALTLYALLEKALMGEKSEQSTGAISVIKRKLRIGSGKREKKKSEPKKDKKKADKLEKGTGEQHE